MEPAGATADFESQPGVLHTATESQPDPFVSVEEPSQAQPASNGPTGTTRPRRGDKTPASFAEYAVIEPSRSQKNKRGCPPKKRVAEAQPAQQQQQQQQHDDLSVIPGLPFLPDLGGAVREFMLGEGPKLSMEDIKHLDQRSIGGEQTAAASHRKRGLTCRIAQTGYPIIMRNHSPRRPRRPARFYEGITLLYANPNKEFPQNFDPWRPFKTKSLARVSRASFVGIVNGRNGPSEVVLLDDKILEDPTKFKLELESPLEVELRNNATYVVVHPTPPIPEFYKDMTLVLPLENGFPEDFDPEFPGSDVEVMKLRNLSRQGFVRAVDRQNGGFVVALEDYPSRNVSKMDPADIELRDGATYIVLPCKGKNYEQAVDDVAAWQRNHTGAEERHVRNKLVKMLEEENHTNVEPVCFKRVTGPGGKFKELDAAAVAEGCAMVAEHKHVMSIKGVEQLQRLITFIEKYRDVDGVGNVSQFRGKRIIGVLASATEVGGEEQEDMNDLIDRLGYKKICTQGLYGDDPCSTFQASGDSCDISASSGTPGTDPTAPPSAVPHRDGRSFLAPMRGPAMLVRPRLVNTRVAGFRIAF